ncbi:carbohydrate binding domain-containing protein [Streptomyces sp. NPDC057253]|uniref:carbohydrate binding domain-containing protein n=1 Tax=Streptomyces sp. NPDC057253 TaxID=3346069 RepID=UPI003632A7BA
MELDLRGELQIGGVWVDATGNMLKRQALTHTRGRQDQGDRVDPSTCRPMLNNTNGQFSYDNPMSPYYGSFGRNTPFRLSLRAGSPALEIPENGGDASTPDTAVLDVTGDIDVRVDLTLLNWLAPDANTLGVFDLFGKYSSGGRSWLLGTVDSLLFFRWSQDGTNVLQANSTVPLPIPAGGRLAIRATLDVDNGASGRTITFFTAPTLAGPWTQLGAPVVQAGTTSIANTSTRVAVGDASDFTFTDAVGRIHKAEIRNGIGGTVVANPDFTIQAEGATSFVDGAGRTWTVAGAASITNRRTRLSHELAAQPVRWHPSGKHVWVEAQTAGILRRLRRASTPLDSTLRRRIPSGSPLAYWPMEDGSAGTQFYSPIRGVRPLRMKGMSPASDDSLAGSSALASVRSLATMFGTVPAPAVAATSWHCEFIFRTDAPSALRTVLYFSSTGTVQSWRLMLDSGGAQIFGYDGDGNTVTSQITNLLGIGVFGAWTRWQLYATQSGGTVNYTIRWVPIGGVGGQVTGSYSGTVGRITGVQSPDTGWASELDGLLLGHISVFTTANTTIYNNADLGFAGETAGTRMQRLATEESLPVTVCGVVSEQEEVGPQRPDAILSLLEEAADADGGILYEDREQPKLRYRDRAGMYNQTPALVLDYTAPGLAPPLEPTGDDDATKNDVTVTRANGSSARAFLEAGAMSVQAPPNGVGPYPASVTLNLASDDQAEPIANWLMWLGTYEGRRYPQVRVMVHKAPAAVVDQILAVDVGDKMVITNPPPWLAPGDVELIVQGYEETFDEHSWDIVFNCTPGRPWTVAEVADIPLAWVDTDGSELASAATSTQTTLDVLSTASVPWNTASSETPYDWQVGGEEVRVAAGGKLVNANPFFDTNITSWSAQNGSISRSTAVLHPQAAGSIFITPNGSSSEGGAICALTPVGSIIPGASYVVSMWAYSPGGWSNLQPAVDWATSAGTYISTGFSAGFAVPAGRWTYLEQTFVAPATASRANVRARHAGTPGAGQTWFAWAVRITQAKAGWLHDAFGRTLTDSWGNAESGQAWTNTGTAADFDVTSGYGSHTLPATSSPRTSTVAVVHPDWDVYCDITTSALATGASLYGSVVTRWTSDANLYMAQLDFNTSNGVVLTIRKRVASSETVLGTYTTGLTHVAGTFVRVRFQGTGTTLRAKAWLASALEPPAWHLQVTDSSLTAAGSIGMRSVSVAGNTNTNPQLRYDNLNLINPQALSVDRSRNGIVKAQVAGEDVRLAHPAIVAL